MAAGDVLGIEVVLNGKFADITLSGLATGGTYATRLGLGVNNNPATGTPLLTLTATSLGYDDAGSATTFVRKIYGTKRVRTPYSTSTINGTFSSGTFVVDETVTQATTGATAKVVIGQASGPRLMVKGVTGSPDNSNIWQGGTSSATFTPSATPATYNTGPHEWYDGTNTHIRVALSDYVYTKDNTGGGNSGTATTFSIGAGLYTSAGTPNNAATGTITNSSTGAYRKIVANWSWPHGYNLITSNTLTLRCVAFGRHANSGRPVRCVRFSATDGSTTVFSSYLTAPVIDRTIADQTPVIEYVGTIDVSTLTQGANITCNFVAYPWVGDSNSILDTSAGTAAPSPKYGPIVMVNDRTGAYGQTYAVVDSVSGSDPAGVTVGDDAGKWVGDLGSFNPAQVVLTAYATIGRAARAIRNYNNANHSRDRVDAGIIYMKAGNYNSIGATISGGYGSTPNAYITCTPFTGVARSSVVINGVSGNTDISDRICYRNVKITSATISTWVNVGSLWFDQCEFDSATDGIIHATTDSLLYVTHCKVTQLRQGIRGSSTAPVLPGIVRGCDLTGFARSILCYCVIGNKKTGSSVMSNSLLLTDIANALYATTDGGIIAFNEFYGIQIAASESFSLGVAVPMTHGYAFVQNMFEAANNIVASGGANLIFVASSEGSTANTPIDNVIHWHNALIGGRCGHDYCSHASTVKQREFHSVVGLVIDSWGMKTDNFVGAENGNNTGNWGCDYGVGWSGNADLQTTGTGTNSFPNEVYGLNAFEASSNTPSYPQFVNRAAFDGTNNGAGDGNYRYQSNSPLFNMVSMVQVLPWDIEGRPRSLIDPPGPFCAGNPRKGGGFFA